MTEEPTTQNIAGVLQRPPEIVGMTKEKWLKQMKELQREVTLEEINNILSTTIKHDDTTKLITFLSMLLTYTEEDQQNLAFKSESARGKSYIPLEIVQYFPEEDLMIVAYASPTAFFHEYGIWLPDDKTVLILLERKILVFLDQPHDLLLQRLRPLLSHDKKQLIYKITDKTGKRGMKTKTIAIQGYPTVIFCSAKATLDEQEKTRLFLLSPEATQDKLKKSIELLSLRLGNRQLFKQLLEEDQSRTWLKSRIRAIKTASISNIIIEDPEEVREKFLETHKFLKPRHQRDFPRLIALIKAHALLNLFTREQVINGTAKCIIANQTDIYEGFRLYEKIVESNELGLSPEHYEIWKKIIEPNLPLIGLTRPEVQKHYFDTYHRHLSYAKLRDEILPALEAAGLIYQEYDPNDKRSKRIYKVIQENIYHEGGEG